MKRVLTPSLFITYPQNSINFKVFPVLFTISLLDKRNVGGDLGCSRCGLVNFEAKNHSNRKRKNTRFGLVRLAFKKKSESNHTKLMRFGLVVLVRFFTKKLLSHTYTYRGKYNFVFNCSYITIKKL